MGVVSLIGRLIKVALLLGVMGTLGEATLGMAKGAAQAHQSGLISLVKLNSSLNR
jgi:hypothetical protein